MKNIFIVTMIVASSLLVSSCEKKTEAKKQIVGIVNLSATLNPFLDGFKEGLSERGFIEGENVEYLYDGPSLEEEDIKKNVETMISAEADLIYTLGGPATKIAHEMAKDKNIPIVFTPVFDPSVIGITEKFQKQSNTITGVRVSGYIAKSLEWLLKIAPNVKKICVPYDPENKNSQQCLKVLEEAIVGKDVELILVEVSTPKDVLNKTPPKDIDAIFIFSDILVISNISNYITLALDRKIPLASTSYSQAKLGALMTYGSAWEEIGAQAARQASLILKGASPSDLPIEFPNFRFSINLATAKSIGIEVSDEILQQADHIVRE